MKALNYACFKPEEKTTRSVKKNKDRFAKLKKLFSAIYISNKNYVP